MNDCGCLYVAMTRAEKWLIVCAAGEWGRAPIAGMRLVGDAMERAGAETVSHRPTAASPLAEVKRLSFGNWPAEAVPGRSNARAPEECQVGRGRPRRNSGQYQAPLVALGPGRRQGVPGTAGADEETAKRRGRDLHLLLQHLPGWPAAEWPQIARSLLRRQRCGRFG